MDEFITTILTSPEFTTAVLTVFVTIVGSAVAFVSKEVRALLRRKLSAEQLALLMKVAEQAVFVAEQTGLDQAAEEKKAEALRIASTYLLAYGIKVSEAQLDAAIEAAVFSHLNQFRVEPEVLEEAVEEEAAEEPAQ